MKNHLNIQILSLLYNKMDYRYKLVQIQIMHYQLILIILLNQLHTLLFEICKLKLPYRQLYGYTLI